MIQRQNDTLLAEITAEKRKVLQQPFGHLTVLTGSVLFQVLELSGAYAPLGTSGSTHRNNISGTVTICLLVCT